MNFQDKTRHNQGDAILFFLRLVRGGLVWPNGGRLDPAL
jgi:hypothetical protein